MRVSKTLTKIRQALQSPSSTMQKFAAKRREFFGGKEFVGLINNRSVSDSGPYIAAVRLALRDYSAFCNFKRDPRYQAILEHVSYAQGVEYLELIRRQSPAFLGSFEMFKENDLVGGASKESYPGVGLISPSTLRYVKVASDLMRLFGYNLGEKVAEIGVGYGGQLLVADKVLKFTEYHLFDLPPVLDLSSKYIEAHNLRSSYKTFSINQHPGDVGYDLVISNYAFSELPSKLQRLYISKIISKSRRGYLTMNSGRSDSVFKDDKLSLFELKALLPSFEILPELPLCAPGNYIIAWGCAD